MFIPLKRSYNFINNYFNNKIIELTKIKNTSQGVIIFKSKSKLVKI